MPVKFSVMLTGATPVGDIAACAARAEALGFDEFHLADDLGFRPAWPLLMEAARVTSRIRLGPFIVTPQLAHPAYHASNLAVLDEVSRGRAVCGIGRGGLNSLVELDRPAKAVRMVREALELTRHVLERQRTAYAGEYFRAAPGFALQFDGPGGDVPLFVGSWGPKMARMAGSVAAGLKADCVANPSWLARLRRALDAGAASAERTPGEVELIVGPLCAVSEDRSAASYVIRATLAFYLPFLSPMLESAGLDPAEVQRAAELAVSGEIDEAVRHVSDDAVAAFALAGTPADVLPRVEALIEAGADHIAFGAPLGPDPFAALELLAREVVEPLR